MTRLPDTLVRWSKIEPCPIGGEQKIGKCLSTAYRGSFVCGITTRSEIIVLSDLLFTGVAIDKRL